MKETGATVLPYHFVPVAGPDGRVGDVPYSEAVDGHDGLHHHRFVEGRRSGRIVCRLTTVTPTVLGAERTERTGRPAKVEPFLLGGRPAIPGSSLRGMISAVAEAASNGALRVLDDRVYSFRKIAKRALRGFGEVVVEGEGKQRRYFVRKFSELYKVDPADVHGAPLETCRGDHRRFYGRDRHGPRKGAKLIPWEEVAPQERDRYDRGIVRVLAAAGRDLPDSRKFEIFVPYDPDKVRKLRKVPIRPQALDRFHELADERTGAGEKGEGSVLPFAPVGRPRGSQNLEDRRFRLSDGDLVFYWEKDGAAVEIALSAIWRERVEDSEGRPRRARSFFARVDPDLVPFHSARTGGRLTLAEQLFGFVSEDDPPSERDATPALASRVRVGFGRLEGDAGGAFLEPCTLRVLGSPKPPSPSLYFSDFHDPEAYVAKHQLDPDRHRPRGRKFYVHQRFDPDSDPASWPWRTRDETDRPELKSEVRPLRHGSSFVFHLDFDNLSDDELGLLLYALRPTEGFRHKLGMGKPVGLGSVRVDVLGLFDVDRAARYRRQGLFAPRYARAAVAAAFEDLGERYRHEIAAARYAAGGGEEIERLRASWRGRMDQEVRDALERLGEETFEPPEVSVPLVVDAEDSESETFKWFVSYEKGEQGGTALAAIGPRGTPWPRLERLQEWQGSPGPPRRGKPHPRRPGRGPRR